MATSSQMDAATALQQFSQLLLLQSLAAAAANSGKSSPSSMSLNSTQFRQMALPQMQMSSKIPQLPSMPSSTIPTTSSDQTSQLDALATISKLLSAHQNLKSEVYPPLSSPSIPSGFPHLQMPSINTSTFRSTPYQHPAESQQQQHQYQRPQPEYRLAVTRESAKPLQDWMNANIHHPYPSPADIQDLSKQTGFTYKQIRNWFTNNRRRYEQQFLQLNQPLPWEKKLASNRKSLTPELSLSPELLKTEPTENEQSNL